MSAGCAGASDPGLSAVRWLHLSDLHFTAEEGWDRRVVLASLLDYLRDEVAGKGLGPDFVVVTGDVAWSGKAAEYDHADAFLRTLMDAVGLEATRDLFVVPGNHDVDRAEIETDRYTVDGLRATGRQEPLERLLTRPDQVSMVSSRLAAFYDFTVGLLGSRGWRADRPWRADVVDAGGIPLGVVQLNTVWASGEDDEDTHRRLLVGEAQVREALAELPPEVRLRLALMHHPLSALAEHDEVAVSGALRGPDGVDLLLRGHLHREEAFGRRGPDGETLELAAGATYTGGGFHKGCLLVELDLAAGKGRAHFLASGRDGGFWCRDSTLYPGAPDGIWTFDLPARLVEPAPAASASTPPPEVLTALTARYRGAAARKHGAMSFLGLPDRSRRPTRAGVGDLFAPLTAGPGAGGGDGGDGRSVAELVTGLTTGSRDGRAPRLVLLGDPGSGKTTLSKYLAVWAAGGLEIAGCERPGELLPLRIPFREYVTELEAGRDHDLVDFLACQARRDLQVPGADRAFFVGALEQGEALVLLDGLDEVSRPGARAAMRDRVAAFEDRYRAAPVLVTSRIVGYDDAPLDERRFELLRLRPLDDGALDELVRRWYAAREPDDPATRRAATDDLLAALRAEPRVRELARNPLIATLVCLVHGQRARLPGERAKLYALVVETLLDTWNQAKEHGAEGFSDIDPGRQRRYLERLALAMQQRRRERERGEPGDVTIEREALLTELTAIAAEPGASGDERAEVRHRVGRWVNHLAARTGLLVEQRPGVFAFLHLTLMEFLAACALSEDAGTGGVDALLERLDERIVRPAWREPILLLMGLRADDPAFSERLAASQLGRDRDRTLLLLQGLREEVDVGETRRDAIVRDALAAAGGTYEHDDWAQQAAAALWQAVRFSRRHGQGARRALVAALDGASERGQLATAILARLPALAGDAEGTLALVDRLRRLTSDGEHLYFLDAALEEAGRRWPEAAARAGELRSGLLGHLPAPDPELFRTVELADGRVVPLWCDIPGASLRVGCVPVTNRQYASFDPGKPVREWEGVSEAELASHPRVVVTWYEAVTFCRWLAARAGLEGARLAAGEEWEHACRAGTQTAYWSGDGEEDLDRVGWYGRNSGGRTHRVGGKPANPWGLYDVHGNVWEWTSDVSGGDGRVLRGGAYWSAADLARSAFRNDWRPGLRNHGSGFRVVLAPAPQRLEAGS